MERLLQQSTLRPVAISEISLRSPKNIRNNIYNFLSAFKKYALIFYCLWRYWSKIDTFTDPSCI